MKKYLRCFLIVALGFFILSFSFKENSFKRKKVILHTQDTLEIYHTKPYKKNVHASYYSDKLNGRKTANGQVFNNSKYTAAHKTLKFGTRVKVTNIVNDKSVIVTINDRGPFVKGREIDLTKKAFMEIAKNKQRGGLTVNLEIVE
ncbi:septal ring lytic transglycosylase RlpA family protein [Flavobacterium sp.]|jgi:rare lipoprotein A|uniref:septal ring lytic transglycosylase RlpA family protein n=1 Tax=Flavobacterium sp. TaxID=239 RepID=UPI002A827A96|nr:septal ring lytic transglycosylase RlpA family protein [Flavobacterium sp.]